jgi:D-glycero-D-manno-heptose 1,7-bisphosphate phosphatase
MMTRQAVVLVGGKGTRLGALAATTPKPLMPIDADAVFLDEVLFNIARHGFDDIVLLAGHFHEQFVDRYSGKTMREATIRIVVEAAPAGTGGAILNAAPVLAETFLFANGDTLFDINLRRLDAILVDEPKALAALALRRVADTARFGSVDLQDNAIVAFREKSTAQPGQDGLINGGIGLLRREILAFIDHTPASIESDIYPRLAAAGRLKGVEFSDYFIDIGLPDTLAQAREEIPRRRRRPAVFFDRDGVLNHDVGYTHRVEDLKWIPGAIETIRRCNDHGALVVVVTNQAGIARGLYTPADVERFHAAMAADLARNAAHIDAFYMCPHHPLAAIDAYRHPDHPDRKPNPGMILKAIAQWPIDSARSVLIGDQQSDMEAARRAGVHGILFAGEDLSRIAPGAFERIGRPAATSAAMSDRRERLAADESD